MDHHCPDRAPFTQKQNSISETYSPNYHPQTCFVAPLLGHSLPPIPWTFWGNNWSLATEGNRSRATESEAVLCRSLVTRIPRRTDGVPPLRHEPICWPPNSEILLRLSERLASFGIIGAQLRAPNTIVLSWYGVLQRVSSIWKIWLPRVASVSDSNESDRWCFSRPGWPLHAATFATIFSSRMKNLMLVYFQPLFFF